MRTALTLGTFDLLHAGHVALFRRCKDLLPVGGRLIVGVNSDDFVERFKGRRPILTVAERTKVLQAIRDVDMVVENDGTNQADLIDNLRPDYLVVGVDWAARDYMGQLGISYEWLASRGIVLLYMAHPESLAVSSTAIRERLTART